MSGGPGAACPRGPWVPGAHVQAWSHIPDCQALTVRPIPASAPAAHCGHPGPTPWPQGPDLSPRASRVVLDLVWARFLSSPARHPHCHYFLRLSRVPSPTPPSLEVRKPQGPPTPHSCPTLVGPCIILVAETRGSPGLAGGGGGAGLSTQHSQGGSGLSPWCPHRAHPRAPWVFPGPGSPARLDV